MSQTVMPEHRLCERQDFEMKPLTEASSNEKATVLESKSINWGRVFTDVKEPLEGSIESFVQKSWSKVATAFSVGIVLSAAVAVTLSVKAGVIAITVGMVALGVLVTAEAARRWGDRLPENWQGLCQYLKVADVETYSFFKFTLCKLSSDPTKEQSEAAKEKDPILFLHGMLGNGDTGNWLLENLKEHGQVYKTDMGTDLASTLDIGYEEEIKKRAQIVHDLILKILEETGKEHITLIGHSRGGVIADYLATSFPDLEGKIVRVVTICSPVKLDVKEGDDEKTLAKAKFMNELCQKVQNATQTQFLQFVSLNDLLTSEDQLLSLEEANDHVTIKESETFGHIGGMFSNYVVEEIIAALAEENSSTGAVA